MPLGEEGSIPLLWVDCGLGHTRPELLVRATVSGCADARPSRQRPRGASMNGRGGWRPGMVDRHQIKGRRDRFAPQESALAFGDDAGASIDVSLDRLGVKIGAGKMRGEMPRHALEVPVQSPRDNVLIETRRLAQEVEGITVE